MSYPHPLRGEQTRESALIPKPKKAMHPGANRVEV